MNVREILITLAKQRPLFHSEADFQHAFAWECHRQLPNPSVRLELPVQVADQPIRLDVWIACRDAMVAVELKYKTRALETQLGSERFVLKNQSAQDIGRYDFIKDIERLERIVTSHENTIGYAVLLTNDKAYWGKQADRKTVDADFRLYEGCVLQGTLQWGANASAGTKRGREEPLTLRGNYTVHWETYSQLSTADYGVFPLSSNQGCQRTKRKPTGVSAKRSSAALTLARLNGQALFRGSFMVCQAVGAVVRAGGQDIKKGDANPCIP